MNRLFRVLFFSAPHCLSVLESHPLIPWNLP